MALDVSQDPLAVFLIGVIDLRGGRAVHAIAGRRDEYRTIDRAWCTQGNPVDLASSYFKSRSLATAGGLYIADLDAILEDALALENVSATENYIEEIYRLVLQASLKYSPGSGPEKLLLQNPHLWVDSGNVEPKIVRKARIGQGTSVQTNARSLRRVIGTESITDVHRFAEQFQEMQSAGFPLTISLDLRFGRVISRCREMASVDPMENLAWFVELGIREFIVLDLTAVGGHRGPVTVDLCTRVAREFRCIQGFRLISGGGVQNEADAWRLVDAGCEGVLVASWLHRLWNEMDDDS